MPVSVEPRPPSTGKAAQFERAPDGAAATAWGALADRVSGWDGELDELIDHLFDQLTFAERLHMLSGDDAQLRGLVEMAKWYNRRPLPAGAVARLGLPGVRFTDGPRGVVMYRSTAFPIPMARAAVFDTDLEERIGDAIGVEARAQGANLFAGICVNLLRHPAWGRAQETYGEDSFLLGEMGAALTRGVQRHLMGCVKHYALNSMENSRFWVDVRVSDADLHEIYLPHFRRIVDEGVAAVMTAYNKVDGTYAGHHRYLMQDILRDRWRFTGFTMSDFTLGVRGPRAVDAGLDLEMPHRMWFRLLGRRVRSGRTSPATIDAAARRLLAAQVRFAGRGEPERYVPESVACTQHRALAREAAVRSIVLLRNERHGSSPVLPLTPDRITRLAVIGDLAATPNIGDHGSSRVHPPEVVTVLDGLRSRCGEVGIEIVHDDGRDPAIAAALAAGCDAVVTVAGTTWRDEGEWVGFTGGDRASLRLPERHRRVIDAVGAANDRHVVVLMGGSAFVTDEIEQSAAALVMAWYPGMEGGHAIAEVLLGEAEPEGRLPLTWPAASTRLPPFRRFARRVTYGPLHGYRMMQATAQHPAFWFGHGLSYTTIDWSAPRLVADEPATAGHRWVTVEVDLTNTGDRPGTEVVQLYADRVLGSHPDPLATLVAVAVERHIEPGTQRTVRLTCEVDDGDGSISIGPSADPEQRLRVAVGEALE